MNNSARSIYRFSVKSVDDWTRVQCDLKHSLNYCRTVCFFFKNPGLLGCIARYTALKDYNGQYWVCKKLKEATVHTARFE